MRSAVGPLVVTGFTGSTLPDDLARDLALGELGGVILFKRNLPDLESTWRLCRDVAVAGDHRTIVSVDQEGGRVARLPPPAAKLPPLRRLGALGDAALSERAGLAVGRELAALGVNLDFAPVLDVDSNPDNPVIGDRSFSSDPERVAELGLAFARGLARAGVAPCGKHFPGHGDTATDSHFDLPRLTHDRARLDRVELLPFQAAARASLASLMTAHVVFEALDPGVPATTSARVITGLLRDELGYTGVVVSDDLEMRALSDRFSIEQSAVAAVRAGCDLLLVCSTPERARTARDALSRVYDAEPEFRARCDRARERVTDLVRRFPTRGARSYDHALAALGAVAEISALIP